MSLNFKYIPLTFLKDLNQIKVQVKNTIILSHFYNKNKDDIKLVKLIEGTQYGYNASALEAGQNKFLRISDITDGNVNWDSVPFCDCSDEETYLLKKDDLLIARTGGTTGKSFLIDNPPSKAIFAGYLIRIRANELSEPIFLNLFLNSYAYWSQVLSLNKGEFRPSVNASKLKQLILPKCNVQEQKDAVRISNGETVKGYEKLAERIKQTLLSFDRSQQVLTEYNTQKQLLTNLKQAILQEAIQGKLTEEWRSRHPISSPLGGGAKGGGGSAENLLQQIKEEKQQLIADKKIKKEKPLPEITQDEIPFEIPDNWLWCRIQDIGILKSGNTYKYKIGTEEDIPFIKVGDMNIDGNFENASKSSNYLKYTDSMQKHLVPLGSIIFPKRGGAIATNKRCNVISKSILIDTNTMAIIVNPSIDFYYFSWWFKNIDLASFGNEAVVPQVNNKDILPIKFPLPPLEEQKVIVEKVATLMQKCTALEQEIKQSETNAQMLMQAVLKEAFEGNIKTVGV